MGLLLLVEMTQTPMHASLLRTSGLSYQSFIVGTSREALLIKL